jgi:putative pyruvate formate lyase activating enzyme
LRLPVVYNSGGYDHVDTLKALEGYVDVYMPDFKYAENAPAEKFSSAPDYADRAREALREMHRQVGDLVTDENGLAAKGRLVRHLVLPGGLAGTKAVMRFLAEEISPRTYVNVMAQYRPANKAYSYRELSRRIRSSEWQEAVACARSFGLHRGLD